jgi:3-hydroxybutyryl-CoA dehydrogenase
LAGMQTQVFDMNAQTLSTAQARAVRFFKRLVEKNAQASQEAKQALGRFHPISSLAEINHADIVIEAIHEDLAAKRALFTQISSIIGPNTLVATNTSALRVNDLADALHRPDRFLGMHYFSPAEVNPLVELVSGAQTSAAALQKAEQFLRQTGKSVLHCKDANGFAVNRFFCPYANEAVRLLDEGLASTGQIDRLAQQVFDLPMGPFAVMNIVKPRIMLNAVKNLSGLGPFYWPADGLIQAGMADTAFEIEAEPNALSQDMTKTVADRLCGALYLPVLEAAADNVARFDDFDMGARLALRFGHPPVAHMRETARPDVTRIVQEMASRHAHPLPSVGLQQLFA